MNYETMIHPTAIIEKGAELGRGVKVGPYSCIGPHVRLGDGCEVRNHATITGHTTVGQGCVFFPGCVIGEVPQDLKYQGEKTETRIGEDNHFREMVTIHAGTALGGGITTIGNHNRILVGVHVAHDVRIGNHVVIANHVQLAGHVHIEDCVNMGGQSGVHHFVTIGRYAMVGGISRVTMDVPPYLITLGYPAQVRGVNFHGLQRWRLPEADIRAVEETYKTLYGKRAEQGGLSFAQRLEHMGRLDGANEHVRYLCTFIRRTLSVGNCGRYLESLRHDRPEDNREFFEKKTGIEKS